MEAALIFHILPGNSCIVFSAYFPWFQMLIKKSYEWRSWLCHKLMKTTWQNFRMLIVNIYSILKWIIKLALRERHISNKYFIHEFIFYILQLKYSIRIPFSQTKNDNRNRVARILLIFLFAFATITKKFQNLYNCQNLHRVLFFKCTIFIFFNLSSLLFFIQVFIMKKKNPFQ